MLKTNLLFTGHEQLSANLKALAGQPRIRAVNAALAAGAKVLADAEKAIAPKGASRALVTSIGSRLMRRRGRLAEAKAGMNVGKRGVGRMVNRGSGGGLVYGRNNARIHAGLRKMGSNQGALARLQARGAPHGHLVALGTRMRTRKRIGGMYARFDQVARSRSTGKMPANPFIRRATASSRDAVLGRMRWQLGKSIGKEVNKLGRASGASVGVT